MENLGTAVELMLVGLPTVFLVLVLIVYFSKLLIYLVNKYVPEQTATPAKQSSKAEIDPKKLSAITAAVATITNGKGRITKVEKL